MSTKHRQSLPRLPLADRCGRFPPYIFILHIPPLTSISYHLSLHPPIPLPTPSTAVGMWKQPSIDAVLSEEERLRQAVFAQVYAELLQKDNSDLSFNAEGQP